MITHNAKFEELAIAPVKQTDVVVARQIVDIYGYHDDTVVWSSSDILMSVSLDSVGDFLSTTTKKATVKLLGIINDIESKQLFNIRTGIYDNDPAVLAFNYVSQGFFYVDTVSYDYEAGSTTVVLYDHMWIAQNTQYQSSVESSGFVFPATVSELATHVANIINAYLTSGFDTLPNADYVIQVDPYATISNVTVLNVIQEIASATGTTARISDTTLDFVQFKINGSMSGGE